MPDFKTSGEPMVEREPIPPLQMQTSKGIMDRFVIGAGTGLAQTIAQGRVVGRGGQSLLEKTSNTDNQFPNMTDDDTTFIYWNARTGAVEYKTTNVGTNPEDVLLGIVTAASADITDIRFGEWAHAETIALVQNLDISATGTTHVYDYWGSPKWIIGGTAVATVDLVGTSAVVKVHHVEANDGTDTEIITFTQAAVTADVTDLASTSTSPTVRSIITPVLIRPGDRLYLEVETAVGTSGNSSYMVHLGGVFRGNTN